MCLLVVYVLNTPPTTNLEYNTYGSILKFYQYAGYMGILICSP